MRVTQITALVNGLVQYKETSKRNIMGASKYNNRATILSGPKCSLELVKWKSVGPCLLWVRPSDIETPT